MKRALFYLSLLSAAAAACVPSARQATGGAEPWGIHRSLVGSGNDLHCEAPATNCFDDIVIMARATAERFNAAVNSGTTAMFFSGDEWRPLFPGLARFPRQLELLRNGIPLLRFESRAQGVTRYLATRLTREQIAEQMRGDVPVRIQGVEFCLTIRLAGEAEREE
jgi:hypothetical protein